MKILYDNSIVEIDITKQLNIQELIRQLIISSFTDTKFLVTHEIKGKIFSMFRNLVVIKSLDMMWVSDNLKEVYFYPDDAKTSFRIIL